jgi:hypothetical protein
MRGLPRFSALALLVALTVLGVFAIPAAAAPPTGLTNGDFQSGTLSGWTTFVTGNGTIGTPAVVSFDTTGSGASNAAQFDVGQVTFRLGVYEGGGIYQSVSTTAGSFDVSADIASETNLPGINQSCGNFELLVDNGVVASHDFGSCQGVVRSTLSASSVPLSAGSHEIRIRITRPYTIIDLPVSEYVDNVALAKPGGGNSTNAKLCQKGGWMNLVRADGTPFANQDECVSYGASGGTISTPPQPRTGAEVCAAYGGIFLSGPALGPYLAWICSWHITDYASQFAALDAACKFDLGSNWAQTYTHPETLTAEHADTDCYRLVAG